MWQNIDNEPTAFGIKQINPQKYKVLKLDVASIKSFLNKIPLEFTVAAKSATTVLELPMPDGTFEEFVVVESPMMEAELAQKFPEIKTYSGYSLKNPATTARLDFTQRGFHGMILSPNGTFFIDPYSTATIEYYISYDKKDFTSKKSFNCAIDQIKQPAIDTPISPIPNKEVNIPTGIKASIGDGVLRNYRLALAATGEYTAFHGGTIALALAAQVTTMNRVNGVFLRDFAVKMNIIANNNLIIYTNATTDPYTNDDGGAMLTENVNNINSVIGSANYDIGHVFSTGGGGVAYLGSPCRSFKGGGVTGSGSPVGDAFDIDYVAHEIGHQFGGNHTQNNECQRNEPTAFEPGSGHSIMGYAGICEPNVQNNSDAHFHGGNLSEMQTFITGFGNTCSNKPTYTNAKPSVTSNTLSQTIPKGTPFMLTGVATDADGNASLTYCWEQMDIQVATQPPDGTATGGPSFRGFSPTSSGTRYFPRLSDLVANVSPTWEVLPTVARTLNFRLVVRDNATGGGANDRVDIALTIAGTAGPFIVNSPNNSGISYAAFSTQTVTWAVASTNIAPVSCSNVDILLSTDGGLTYSTTLASNVSNSGSAVVTIPNISSTTARIMVKGTDRAFFDISNNNFTITSCTALSAPTTVSVNNTNICSGSSVLLNATCTTGTVTWYNAATGGASLGTGTGLSQTPTSTITYYASCENEICKSVRVATSQVTTTNPTAVSVDNTNICAGNSVSLTATCATGTITWYNVATGGASLGTGNGLSQTPASTITYYASCENANCISARVATSQVTVTAQPTNPIAVSVNNTNICAGNSVSLSATCTTGTITWYNSATGSTSLGTGTGLSQTPTSTITYYASCEIVNCKSARMATSQVTVTAQPTQPNTYNINNSNICAGNSVSLTAACSIGTVTWYNAATGGAALGTGTGLSQTPTSTITYYASCEIANCKSSRTPSDPVTVTAQPTNPTSVSVNNTNICLGNSVSLSATCATGTVTWYNAATGGASLGTGTGLSQTPASSITYYASCENASCKSARVATNQVTVTAQPTNPTSVAINSINICAGNSVSLTATCATGTITWYNAATGGASLGTGTGLSQTPASSITYYASCENASCKSARVATNQVTITAQPTNPTVVSVNNTNICPENSVLLNATCTTGTVTWYNAATGGASLGTGTGLSQTPTSTITYYASCENEICKSVRVATSQVTVTAQPNNPTTVSVNNTNICAGSTVSLVATCVTGTITWYNAAIGGASLGTGTGLSQTPASTITYYASCENAICKSARVATNQVTVTAQPTNPTAVSVNNTNICPGNSVSLNATCATGTVTWYNAATGGASLGTGTGLSQTPASTIIYYASCENVICKSVRVATNQVTVAAQTTNPTGVSVDNTNICAGNSVSLAATCATGTITWYNVATGSASLGTGTGLSQTPASTITYYASCEIVNCKSARVATNQVTVTAKPIDPTAVSVDNTNICAGNIVSLTATCITGSITWYNAATGGTAIGTGTGLSQTPASTITYYASCEIVNCKSARVATSQVTVLPQTNSVTSNIFTGTSIVQAAQTINASNKVISPAKVTYKAGNSISLNTGFEAQTGSVFVAQIQGCN
jgi:hypothetical protein